jgi:hypothetical protein
MGATAPRKGWRYRANVAARVIAGTLGAYVVAALFAATLAFVLPMPKVEAIMPATMLAFLVGPAVTLWAFLARGPWRAWAGLLLMGAALAAILWSAGGGAVLVTVLSGLATALGSPLILLWTMLFMGSAA